MPWKEASPMDQRTQFIADHLRDTLSITELCELDGISRKTGYKWIDRYLRQGPAGLEERSRRPRGSPNATSEEIVAAILEARRRHPRWGGKKLLAPLHKRHPRWGLPGRSTACDILRRHGMVPRPHEALDQETPAACYEASRRPMPDRLPPLEYPDRFEVRYVSANGGIRWNSRWVNVSTVCVGEYVGLEEIDDGIWTVYFGPVRLGRLSERHMRIEDEYGTLYRRHV